jgi:hypothetical protein
MLKKHVTMCRDFINYSMLYSEHNWSPVWNMVLMMFQYTVAKPTQLSRSNYVQWKVENKTNKLNYTCIAINFHMGL